MRVVSRPGGFRNFDYFRSFRFTRFRPMNFGLWGFFRFRHADSSLEIEDRTIGVWPHLVGKQIQKRSRLDLARRSFRVVADKEFRNGSRNRSVLENLSVRFAWAGYDRSFRYPRGD